PAGDPHDQAWAPGEGTPGAVAGSAGAAAPPGSYTGADQVSQGKRWSKMYCHISLNRFHNQSNQPPGSSPSSPPPSSAEIFTGTLTLVSLLSVRTRSTVPDRPSGTSTRTCACPTRSVVST